MLKVFQPKSPKHTLNYISNCRYQPPFLIYSEMKRTLQMGAQLLNGDGAERQRDAITTKKTAKKFPN